MIPDINLLPKMERESSLAYKLFLIALSVIFILLAGIIFYYMTTKNNIEETEALINDWKEEIVKLEAELASMDTEEEKVTLEAAVEYVSKYNIPTSTLIDELNDQLLANTYISNYQYNYQTIQLNTGMTSIGDTANYLTNLMASNFITKATINDITSEEGIYNARYSLEINHEYLLGEEEQDE